MRNPAGVNRPAKSLSLAVAGAFAVGLHAGLIFFAVHAFAGPTRSAFGARSVMLAAAGTLVTRPARPAPEAGPALNDAGAGAAAHEAEMRAPAPAAPGVTEAQPLHAARDADYVDASLLSTRPRPEGEIAIPEPEVGTYRGTFKAVLVVFIDETGHVARVEVDRSDLPAEFELSAREAFARARFRPGLIGARPVRSRLRIEVGFDSGVLAPEAPSARDATRHES